MTEQITITIEETQAGLRLDKALAALVEDLSRSRIQQLIADDQVVMDNVVITDAKKKVEGGEECIITIPEVMEAVPKPQNIPLDIVYEDEALLVINKPAGLTVHPGAGNPDGTLVNALLHHCGESLSGIGGVARPGIVHRLDKDTSGLMVVAKHDAAHKALAAQLEDRSLSRRYQALVWGLPHPTHGTIDAPIGRDPNHRQRMCVITSPNMNVDTRNAVSRPRSPELRPTRLASAPAQRVGEPTGEPGGNIKGAKEAITHYQLAQAYGMLVSLVECTLQTGRTHQIRVHMRHIGHPLVGDVVYGGKKASQLRHQNAGLVKALREFPRQALHAKAIAFIHPISGEAMQFECDLAKDMQELQRVLGTSP